MMRRAVVQQLLALAGILSLFPAGQASGAMVPLSEALRAGDHWRERDLTSAFTAARMAPARRAAALAGLSRRAPVYLSFDGRLGDVAAAPDSLAAFILSYAGGGFVIVSADDRLPSILAFDPESPLLLDEPQRNFMRAWLQRWAAVARAFLASPAGRAAPQHPTWQQLKTSIEGEALLSLDECGQSNGTTCVLWSTPTWDQSPFYNDLVIQRNAGTMGILTGCTATAMAIKMRYHEFPAQGSGGVHSYWDTWGAVQFFHTVNFSSQTFNWDNMPADGITAPNADVAALMYDCGVAVHMDYEVGESRAWPSAAAMNNLFGYIGTVERNAEHEGALALNIQAGLPVVLSTSAHTVVATGYRQPTTPFYYINCGWGGANNAWYALNNLPGGDLTIDRSYPYCQPTTYVYVDLAGPSDGDGRLATPYPLLGQGYAATNTNGTLWLRSGSYTTPFTFSRRMTIRSYSGTATIGQ